jgi:hypothetical protein
MRLLQRRSRPSLIRRPKRRSRTPLIAAVLAEGDAAEAETPAPVEKVVAAEAAAPAPVEEVVEETAVPMAKEGRGPVPMVKEKHAASPAKPPLKGRYGPATQSAQWSTL